MKKVEPEFRCECGAPLHKYMKVFRDDKEREELMKQWRAKHTWWENLRVRNFDLRMHFMFVPGRREYVCDQCGEIYIHEVSQ